MNACTHPRLRSLDGTPEPHTRCPDCGRSRNVCLAITSLPEGMDPATAHATLEHAEEFGFRVRDLMDRGHKARDAIVIALKNSGTYEILSRRPGAMERIFAYFEGEVERLQRKLDEKSKIVRGVPIVKVGRKDDPPDPKIYAPDGTVVKRIA